jgi:hypothetical protein
MNNSFLKGILLSISITTLVFPGVSLAHQPRIVDQNVINVTDPEISKAYYGQLSGEPHYYYIKSEKEFNLYVNVLVPDINGIKKDVSAIIVKDEDDEHPIAKLDGPTYEWKKFWEPFGGDSYWMGPEYKTKVEPGEYEIEVYSTNNDSKYALAIGETEAFDQKEGLNALNLVPQLKNNFFNESAISFILSPFGWGYIVVMYILSFIFGFTYRAILKKFAKRNSKRKRSHNIGNYDRIFRAILGVILLIWATTTNWNPVLLFFSGFCFFEAIFSWCGFYAAIGKNSCPIE